MTRQEKKDYLSRYRRARGKAGEADCESLRRQVAGAIGGMEDRRLRQLLEYRYLDGMTWEQVAERTYTDCRWLMRLHNRALDSLPMEG